MRTVGILGGMGPEATVLLMQRVIAAVPAEDDADHVPLIVHQNPQVPSRIKALIEGQGDDPGPVLTRMARTLEAAGATALAMPCNTAHHFAKQIENAVTVPFLNMIEATAGKLPAGRIGMLASPAVRKVGVFDGVFERHGITALWPQDEAPVLDVIRAVKAGQQVASDEFASLAADLARDCDHILIACTELSLLTKELPEDLPWTDSLDVLVQEIVAFATADA